MGTLKRTIINPFKPTAGAEPPVLIGRERVIDDFRDGIEEGVGAPGRLMRITGPRGSGKTALLTELGDIAKSYGWRVVDVTAAGSIVDAVQHELARTSGNTEVHLEASLGVVKAGVSKSSTGPETLRGVLTSVASQETQHGAGLLVTVDEIQDADADDVRLIAAAVQHLIRERKNIAFVFAGLTMGVMDLINGRALTFLQRAKAEELASIPLSDVSDSMASTVEGAGLHLNGKVLEMTACATRGYAYLVQLVGYRVFANARKHADRDVSISLEDARKGIEEAYGEFEGSVLDVALADLPLRAIEYLIVMAKHEGNVPTKEIAAELSLPPASLTATRRQLIKAQVIDAPSRGVVRFSIPLLREYLLKSSSEILSRY